MKVCLLTINLITIVATLGGIPTQDVVQGAEGWAV